MEHRDPSTRFHLEDKKCNKILIVNMEGGTMEQNLQQCRLLVRVRASDLPAIFFDIVRAFLGK